MPGLPSKIPEAPHYIPPSAATEDLDYADLAVIDLSKSKTPQGQAELVLEVKKALETVGFFYVVNHGWTKEQTSRMFDIADIPFSVVGDDEKRKYAARIKETGSYQGYKPREYWHIDAGVRDQLEHYNIHPDVTKKEHPVALRPFMPEIQEFARHTHVDVMFPLLRALTLGLELPGDFFINQHKLDGEHDCWIRFMKYYPRSTSDEERTKNVWLKGHKDPGTLTFLYSQPISALQIQYPDGTWKWIKHMENAMVVNAGEALEFLSGGIYQGTIHRVVQPPPSQQGLCRLGLFYFAVTNDDVKLAPLVKESPVLQRAPVIKRRWKDDERDAPTMGTWIRGRVANYGKSALKDSGERGVEVEYISGVLVRHYN